MPSKRYTYKREYCPFNTMIECAQHGGNKPPNLPDCCTHCGWNPAEAEQRRIRLEASVNGK